MACGRSTLVPATSQLLFSTHSCGLFRPSLAHPRQARFLHSSARRPPHTSSPTHTAQMSRASRTSRASPSTSLEEAQDLFKSSDRILALCGAGLSAASGLPTFRGSGGLWRNHDPIKLANAKAFRQDPALVWLFYAWRRHLALSAQPNGGHYALAELARKNKNFLCLTQNVDCEHPPLSLPCARYTLTMLSRSFHPRRSPRKQPSPAPRQPVRHQVLRRLQVRLRRGGQLPGSALPRPRTSVCSERAGGRGPAPAEP